MSLLNPLSWFRRKPRSDDFDFWSPLLIDYTDTQGLGGARPTSRWTPPQDDYAEWLEENKPKWPKWPPHLGGYV